MAVDDSFILVPCARRKIDAAKTFGGRHVIYRRRAGYARRHWRKFLGRKNLGRVELRNRGGVLRIIFRAQQKNSARTKICNDDNLGDDGNLRELVRIFLRNVDTADARTIRGLNLARRAYRRGGVFDLGVGTGADDEHRADGELGVSRADIGNFYLNADFRRGTLGNGFPRTDSDTRGNFYKQGITFYAVNGFSTVF